MLGSIFACVTYEKSFGISGPFLHICEIKSQTDDSYGTERFRKYIQEGKGGVSGGRQHSYASGPLKITQTW